MSQWRPAPGSQRCATSSAVLATSILPSGLKRMPSTASAGSAVSSSRGSVGSLMSTSLTTVPVPPIATSRRSGLMATPYICCSGSTVTAPICSTGPSAVASKSRSWPSTLPVAMSEPSTDTATDVGPAGTAMRVTCACAETSMSAERASTVGAIR